MTKKRFTAEMLGEVDAVQKRLQKQMQALHVIRYYAWLEMHGVKYDEVAGYTGPIPMSPAIRGKWRERERELGFKFDQRAKQAICYKLKGGEEAYLPYPPFKLAIINGDKG